MKVSKISRQLATFVLVTLFFVQLAFTQTVKVDSRIPKYKKVTGISGNANSIGSDTMNNLMALWLVFPAQGTGPVK